MDITGKMPEGLFPFNPNMLVITEIKPTFEIVDIEAIQEPTSNSLDWRELLDDHIKQATSGHRPAYADFGTRIHEIILPREWSDQALKAILDELFDGDF